MPEDDYHLSLRLCHWDEWISLRAVTQLRKINTVMCPVPGKSSEDSPHIALEREFGCHTDDSATDSCGDWAIFVLGSSESARFPHVKVDLVSNIVYVVTVDQSK